MEVAVLLKLT